MQCGRLLPLGGLTSDHVQGVLSAAQHVPHTPKEPHIFKSLHRFSRFRRMMSL